VANTLIDRLYPDLVKLSRDEHAAWQDVCTTLVRAGAVTPEDLRSRVADDSTPGRKLLGIIRHWGRLAAAIAVEERR